MRFHQAHSQPTPASNGSPNGHANGDGKTAKPGKKDTALPLPPRPAGEPGPDHPTGDAAADLGPTVFKPALPGAAREGTAPLERHPRRAFAPREGKRSTGAGAAESSKTAKGEHFGLYYELHGSGPVKVLFIMGLNMSCFGWLPQVEHLVRQKQPGADGKEQDKYQVLVFDQRGYGNSDVPSGRYTTAQMAQDALRLMAHPDIGWLHPEELVVHPRSAYSTGEPLPSPSSASPSSTSSASSPNATTEAQGSSSTTRKVHLVGVSMGGMITLELLKKYPHLIRSATLISTTSGRARGAADTLLPAAPWEEPPSHPSDAQQEEEEEQEQEPGTESDPTSPFHLSHLASLPSRKGFLTGLPPLRGVAAIARVMLGRVLGPTRTRSASAGSPSSSSRAPGLTRRARRSAGPTRRCATRAASSTGPSSSSRSAARARACRLLELLLLEKERKGKRKGR